MHVGPGELVGKTIIEVVDPLGSDLLPEIRQARESGQPVSRDEILAKIWGLEGAPTNRTVDNFVVKLRKKIEKSPDKPQHILTVYGYGYKLAP